MSEGKGIEKWTYFTAWCYCFDCRESWKCSRKAPEKVRGQAYLRTSQSSHPCLTNRFGWVLNRNQPGGSPILRMCGPEGLLLMEWFRTPRKLCRTLPAREPSKCWKRLRNISFSCHHKWIANWKIMFLLFRYLYSYFNIYVSHPPKTLSSKQSTFQITLLEG